MMYATIRNPVSIASSRIGGTKVVKIRFDRFEQKIIIGSNLIGQFINDMKSREYASIVPIIDINIYNIHRELLQEIFGALGITNIIKISPIEVIKSIEGIGGFVDKLYKFGVCRKSCILGIGGGITGDLAGFLASIYMRGIDFVFLPTTLMSQGDSIIGKVGVGRKNIKNIVGNFYSPRFTYCDIDFIRTQDERSLSFGMSEIIKSALIKSPQFVKYLGDTSFSSPSDYVKLPWINLIYRSLQIKAELVERDQYDMFGTQKGLSYGHTIANALEGLCDFHLNHGEAVNLGMRIAGEISSEMKILPHKDLEIQNKLLDKYKLSEIIPFPIEDNKLIDMLKRDKLSLGGQINLVLLEKIGKFKVYQNIDSNLITKVMKRFKTTK